jgi:hypothetical protein
MVEGWYGDEYIALFGEAAPKLEAAYALPDYLPGYRLVGLKGWDDFIVRDSTGAWFTVPTVPLSSEHLESYGVPDGLGERIPEEGGLPPFDEQGRRKIKWYIQPIVFGGDPGHGDNLTWVTLEQHAELVRWWNRKYRELAQHVWRG